MNLKKLLIFMLVGIVCSVSVVSAADINDTAVEIESYDATIGVDELSNDDSYIQKMDDGIGKVPTPEDLDNLSIDKKYPRLIQVRTLEDLDKLSVDNKYFRMSDYNGVKMFDYTNVVLYSCHEFDMFVPYFNSSTGCHWEISPDSYGVEFLGQTTQNGLSYFTFRINFDDDPFYVKLSLINSIGDVVCDIDTVMLNFNKI